MPSIMSTQFKKEVRGKLGFRLEMFSCPNNQSAPFQMRYNRTLGIKKQ